MHLDVKANNMNLANGDALYVTKTPYSDEVSICDPDCAKKMEIARRGMKKYRNTLIKLAK